MAAEYIENRITLTAPDGVRIPAVEVRPATTRATILLLHGITTQKDEFGEFFVLLAHAFARAGIASLRIDFRGHGESPEPSRHFSIASQILDTITAVAWLAEPSGAKVHLLGCSFGSPPAIFAAAMRPAQVATLNLVCPVLDYDATFLRPTTEWARALFNPQTIERAFREGTLSMNETFIIDVKLLIEMNVIHPATTLRDITTPTLIVHGEADSMVPASISKRVTAHVDHVHLDIVPGMDHGYYDTDDETGETPASQRNLTRIIESICSHVLEGR